MEISMYSETMKLIQKFFTERYMDVFMYPVTLRVITFIQKFLSERVHENFHVPCNWDRLIQHFLTKRVHANDASNSNMKII